MIFLRPWFLLLALIPIVFRVFRERLNSTSSWEKVIDERLLPYLLVKGTNASAKKRSVYKTIIWVFLCFALAGPAWEKENVQTQTNEPGTVIVLEISPVLSGQNLIRAQQKIYDILNHLEGEQVGLVLYDRFGYTAGPLTFELDIIRDMVPSLDMSVLPETNINPNAGFNQANRILENAGIKEGRILFLTSGINWPDNFISNTKRYNHKIGVLGIGSETPYPVALKTGGFLTDKNNKPIMFSLDRSKLSQLGPYHPMTADDKDIQYLLNETPVDAMEEHISGQSMILWKDMGGYFVLATLPFFALLFRKGVLMGLLLFFALSAEAGLWRRPDQEAYDKQMIGVQNYQAKRYDRAESIFKLGKNADDMYNYGNALAFQQKIQEAIDAYQKALTNDPKHEDARFNKEYLEKKLEEEKKRQEEEQRQKEKEQQQKEQQEKLEQLKDLLNQEQEQKQKELDELKNQQPESETQDNPETAENQQPESTDSLSQLKEQLEEELAQKEKQQERLSELTPENEDKMKQELNDLKQQLQEEIQTNQERQSLLRDNPNLKNLMDQIQKENELKQQEVNTIREMLPSEEQGDKAQNEPPQPEKEKVPEKEEPTDPPQQETSAEQNKQEQNHQENVFDQESQEILNHLEQDSDSILRYRIRQQYLRKTGALK